MDNDVYYKIYVTRDDLITVVCMQWFDEDGYDQKKFYLDEQDEVLRFTEEQDAIDFINEKFKPEYIDPEYRISPNWWRHRERD